MTNTKDASKKKRGWEWIEFATAAWGLASPDNKIYGSYKYAGEGRWTLEIYRTVAPVAAMLPLTFTGSMKEVDAREWVETKCLAV